MHDDHGPADRPANLHALFFGREGLRAGWGLLLFLVLFNGFQIATALIFQSPRQRVQTSPVREKALVSRVQSVGAMLSGESVGFGLVSFTTWIMGRVERRRVASYGFGGTRRIKRFFAGFAWGIVFLSALVGALWKAGLLVCDGQRLVGSAIFMEGAAWLLIFLFVGLLEEYLLRGYLQFTLSRGVASLCETLLGMEDGRTWGFWISAAVLSFFFGFGHRGNPGESPFGLMSAGLIGLVFCFSLWRTGALWWALGFHAAWDWAQSFLFGVADSGFLVEGRLLGTHPAGSALLSGGATGPEGSALILPLLIMIAVVIASTMPGKHEWPVGGAERV